MRRCGVSPNPNSDGTRIEPETARRIFEYGDDIPAANSEQAGGNVVIALTILIGCVVGLLARLTTRGHNPAGFFGTAVLGITGAVLGTFNGYIFGWYQAGETAGLAGALIGAILVVWSYYVIRRNPAI
jgi:uncharacterized membrane protein YeaQ/YmgE (transglycosylase-associated protein family)